MHKTTSYLRGQGQGWRCISWRMENYSLQFQFGRGWFSSAEILLSPDCGQRQRGCGKVGVGGALCRPGTVQP